MVYLEKFVLPDEEGEYRIARLARDKNGGYLENGYPCALFPAKGLCELDFEPATLLYGGNGSGKSTLLNLIALRLGLKRFSPYNSGELMQPYADSCRLRLGWDDEGRPVAMPAESRIITSDDVFEYMLAARSGNDEIREDTETGKDDYARLKYGKNIRLEGMDSYEDFRLQVLSRRKAVTRRRYLHEQIGREVRLESNGETALEFFETYMENDALYCLDEPENSLSPKLQQELGRLLEQKLRYCGCQLVIASHSPFLLALHGAKIYDLDAVPVDVKPWWALENTKTYYEFFQRNRELFER